ncbi:MAG TPA: peptide deformylase [Syntrophales bacterium]|nr:peptide deformylase [Syntrophales bacterium]
MLLKKKDKKSVSPETAAISEIRDKYEVKVATVVDDSAWVKTRASEIDPDKELHLAVELDGIMRLFRKLRNFVGVSSNNIYWNLTRTPIRQILIPTPERDYVSLINPKILKLEGEDINCVEACGSVPGKVFVVRRKPFVSISGYTLEKQYIELEYGSKDHCMGGELIYSSYSNKEWIIQHEMDHLEGITIADKGTKMVWDFRC